MDYDNNLELSRSLLDSSRWYVCTYLGNLKCSAKLKLRVRLGESESQIKNPVSDPSSAGSLLLFSVTFKLEVEHSE